MNRSRRTLLVYSLAVLVLGGLVGANRWADARSAQPPSGGQNALFYVVCRDILITEMAADQSCWTAPLPAQFVGASAACDTAASNVAAAQLTHDETVALTPEAAGAGADLLGRVRATVTPTGFFISDPASLVQQYWPQPRLAPDGTIATAIPGFVGIVDPTAVAGGETFFKPGDRLSIDFSAVPTAAAGCTFTAVFTRR